ncbi:hypothetical protein AVEN_53486-1 [Araneus ventricosus]|uniref:Uncharacterized protein n=1 Tax=Araneus ventricosus TaxID=182803 RepID=A0A4Y2AB70_ARAVE|nr:hypothetical protein AVEN_53486-1 [Araneus ventricosus]
MHRNGAYQMARKNASMLMDGTSKRSPSSDAEVHPFLPFVSHRGQHLDFFCQRGNEDDGYKHDWIRIRTKDPFSRSEQQWSLDGDGSMLQIHCLGIQPSEAGRSRLMHTGYPKKLHI